ncbi:MAG: hypothetical protein SangKO_005590 [Sandaracinaceae bacterium]
MSRARAALALLLFGYAGCGGASMVGEPTTVTPERESPAELEGEQISLTEDLETVLARAPSPTARPRATSAAPSAI